MSASDLARFGLLIATGGIWKGERLVDRQWLRGHAGLNIHVVAGDPATQVSIAKINTVDFPFGSAVGTQGKYSFPPDLVAGPVNLAQQAADKVLESCTLSSCPGLRDRGLSAFSTVLFFTGYDFKPRKGTDLTIIRSTAAARVDLGD